MNNVVRLADYRDARRRQRAIDQWNWPLVAAIGFCAAFWGAFLL